MHLSTDARAQSSTSPFQPSLTDPRNVQRFKAGDNPVTRATPAAILPPSGAGETGFDSTGAIAKKKKAKKKPGEPRPLPPPPPPLPGPPQAAGGHTIAPQIRARAPYAEAYKPPDAPVRRPGPPLQDAFEPLGVRVGSFLLKPSIEVTRGLDSNPTHRPNGKASDFTTLESGLKLQSDWERNEYRAELRGSLSRFDSQPQLNAPLVDAKTFTRLDVTRDTKINLESRLFLSTDYPGSPNLPAGIAKLPIYTAYGNTVGLTQSFNHLDLSAKATYDRTTYQDSKLTDGTTSSNHDRDYTQYGGAVRASYEVFPGVRPFAELGADTRRHDLQFDRNGNQRDSQALTPKIGSTFELTRKLTGEVSVGYLVRRYQDPTLRDLSGVIFDASLKWEATGLTTATLAATSRAEESVVAGWSGALRRDVGVQVDHALRRWLIWTVKAGYGLDEYVSDPCTCAAGQERRDNRTSLGTALAYKFNRDLSLRGEYRYDQLRSNAAGVNYNASVFLIGLKLQR
ncbi:MAG: hypothetical protein QOF09_5501 [Alphaproteobacteria bacterium]|nr:hypothetical protein [Alphaproteobacteria bacterium]